jgi:hypothetical protein
MFRVPADGSRTTAFVVCYLTELTPIRMQR